MKKFVAIATIGALLTASAAFADTTPSDVGSDVGAIAKDDKALAHDNMNITKDRMAKAKAKSTNSYGEQAKDSLAIGADKTVKGEKEVEKNVDKKILSHDTGTN